MNLKPDYRAINPQMRVPALQARSGEVLTQSLAIIEYLDETHPQPPLLPRDPIGRAKVRAVAQLIACDIHPLNNVGAAALPQERARPGPGHDRRLVSPLGARRLRRARGACSGPAPMLRHRRHARRHLPGAAGRQCAAAEGAARHAIPKIVAVDAACAKLPAFEKARAGEPARRGIGTSPRPHRAGQIASR